MVVDDSNALRILVLPGCCAMRPKSSVAQIRLIMEEGFASWCGLYTPATALSENSSQNPDLGVAMCGVE